MAGETLAVAVAYDGASATGGDVEGRPLQIAVATA